MATPQTCALQHGYIVKTIAAAYHLVTIQTKAAQQF